MLGCILNAPGLANDVVDKLTPEHFAKPSLRVTFGMMMALHKAGKLSYTTLFNELRKSGKFRNPEAFLTELHDAVFSSAELPQLVQILDDRMKARRLMAAGQALQELAISGEPWEVCQQKADEILFALAEGNARPERTWMDAANAVYDRFMLIQQGQAQSGVRVGLPDLDLKTNGFRQGDLIVLAARPSMGKTSLALNWAMHLARKGNPVGIFSLEMDQEQLAERAVAVEGRFSSTILGLRFPPLSPIVRQVGDAINVVSQLPFHVDDRRGLTATDIRASARRLKRKVSALTLIVIDYLQLIRLPGKQPTVREVGEVVRELRDMAGELDLPVVLLSQLNRGVEARDDKRPKMSDLRDSGNIEEFADVVIFVYRDEYYYPERAKANGTQGMAELIIAKQRKGPTGKVIVRFDPETTRFWSEDRSHEPPPEVNQRALPMR